MQKLYSLYFLILLLFICLSMYARSKHNTTKNSSTIIIHLDDSKYGNIPLTHAYIVFDRYDLTGAGIIRQQFKIVNRQITITDVPEGKYFVDVITMGNYRQHFTTIMKASKGTSDYTLKLDDVVFCPNANQLQSEGINIKDINTLTAFN